MVVADLLNNYLALIFLEEDGDDFFLLLLPKTSCGKNRVYQKTKQNKSYINNVFM